MRGSVDAGSVGVVALAVGVAVVVVVGELVADAEAVAVELVADEEEVVAELVAEPELVEPPDDGAELAGADEVVVGGGCECVVVGELGWVEPDSGSTYC